MKFARNNIVETLGARMGTGGNNVPCVMNERQYALTVSKNTANTLTSTDYKGTQCLFEPITLKIRSGCEGGGKGPLVQKDKSATLGCNNDQTLFEPKAYGICSQNSKNQGGIAVVCVDRGGGKSSCNISEDLSPTLAGTHGGEPAVCVQGSVIGRDDKNGPNGSGVNEDVSFTLNVTDKHAVAYGIDRAAFNQGQNAQSCINANETVEYAVRRLTPTECARLQGFPDWWCSGLETEKPTNEDILFWHKVFEEYRLATAPDKKAKTGKQIIKWLKDPYSDSAEYKMWGNGVCLSNVWFVLAGIVWAYGKECEK